MGNPLSQGLVLHLPMDEGVSTKVFDQSEHQNNGTINGASWANGKFGKALDFDGTNDNVTVTRSPSLNLGLSSFSLCAWINTTDSEGDIINNWDGSNGCFLLMVYNAKLRGHIAMSGNANAIDSPSNVNDGQWHFVYQVVDGTKIYLYIDGVLVNSQTLSGIKSGIQNNVIIGERLTSGTNLDGIIDEVRIYNRALSAEEVRTLYLNDEAEFSLKNGLVLHLPFSEAIGTKVGDLSQYLNNGTISGAVFMRPYENDTTNEGGAPIVIMDDNAAADWTIDSGGSLSDDSDVKVKGVNSLKIVAIAGNTYVQRYWASAQDFSGKDFIAFWWYGINDSQNIILRFHSGGLGANYWQASFVDNFSGWKRIIIPYGRFTLGGGSFLWNAVNYLQIILPTARTNYLDRTIVDVGNWRFGEALDFDGTDDKVTVTDADSLSVTNQITISCWIKGDTLANDAWNVPLSKGGTSSGAEEYTFMIALNRLRLELYIGAMVAIDIYPTTPFSNGTWYHIVATYDGANMKLYVDGKLIGQQAQTGNLAQTAWDLLIGIRRDNSNPFDGIIDEVRIYNRALSVEEIQSLYQMKGDA